MRVAPFRVPDVFITTDPSCYELRFLHFNYGLNIISNATLLLSFLGEGGGGGIGPS